MASSYVPSGVIHVILNVSGAEGALLIFCCIGVPAEGDPTILMQPLNDAGRASRCGESGVS